MGLETAMGAHRGNLARQQYEEEQKALKEQRDWERNRLTRMEGRQIDKETQDAIRRDEAQRAMQDVWGQFFQQQNIQPPSAMQPLQELPPQELPQEPPQEPVTEPYVDAMPYQPVDMPQPGLTVEPVTAQAPMDAPLPPLQQMPMLEPRTYAYKEAGAPPAQAPPVQSPPTLAQEATPQRQEPTIASKEAAYFQKLMHAASLNPDNPAIQALLRAEIERQTPESPKYSVRSFPVGDIERTVVVDQYGNVAKILGEGKRTPMVSVSTGDRDKAIAEGMKRDRTWVYEKYLPQLHEEERAARDNINRLQIINALPKHGILANFKKYGSQIAEVFGGSGEWASDVRLFQQTVGPMAFNALRVLGGNDSDKDRQFALDTMSKETDTETAIRRYVATKTVEERRKIGQARHIRKYLNANPDADITDAEDDFRAKQKPVLEEPEMREIFGGTPPDDLPSGASFLQWDERGRRVYLIPGRGPQVEMNGPRN